MLRYSADLHIHSTSSDGILEPLEIIQKAKKLKLSAVSLTDHDTVEGVKKIYQSHQGKPLGIEVIPGVELSTDYKNEEIHILGYYINIYNETLNKALESLKKNRMQRIKKMVVKLNNLGCDVNHQKVLGFSETGTIGRPHVARALVENGCAESVREAFDKYLKKGRPAYIPRTKLTPRDAIELITESGGVPIWAHPNMNTHPKLCLMELMEMGIQGIELYHPYHTINFEIEWRRIAEEHQLIMTGGSDYHSYQFPSLELGEKCISIEQITRLQKAKKTSL